MPEIDFSQAVHGGSFFFLPSPVVNSPPVHFCSLLPIFQVAKPFPLAKLFCIHFKARLYTSCWPLCTIPGPLLHRSLGRYCFKRESSDCALCSTFIIKKCREAEYFYQRRFMLFSFNECQEVAVTDGLLLNTTSRQMKWLSYKKKKIDWTHTSIESSNPAVISGRPGCMFLVWQKIFLFWIHHLWFLVLRPLICSVLMCGSYCVRHAFGPSSLRYANLDVQNNRSDCANTYLPLSYYADFSAVAPGGIQCVNHVCRVWLRCQVQYH